MKYAVIQNFVFSLWNELKINQQIEFGNVNLLLKYGHLRGWLEDKEELHPFDILDKRTAARIIHQFMKIELKIPDEENISKAEELKDLYTCRVCANHIAQVYVKGIMKSTKITDFTTNQTVKIFDSLAQISQKEQNIIIKNTKKQILLNKAE